MNEQPVPRSAETRVHKSVAISKTLCADETCWCWADDRALREWWTDSGHDPDLDENGICRICGKFEPE